MRCFDDSTQRERRLAPRKANEMKFWPHLEAVAVFGKWVRYSNSALKLEGKMFNKPCWSISFIKNVFFLKSVLPICTTTLPFFNLFQMAGHQLWGLLLGISLVTIGLGGLALADCPEVCTCKWKGGKQTVECINASLSSIPSLEAGTQVLDLSLNYLPTLRTDTFSKHNLTNLQKIYLPRCSLRILEVHTFR